MNKFVGDVFKDISNRGFFSQLFYYMIDSRERTKVRIDSFLKSQIDNPDSDVKELADHFALVYPNPDERIIEILIFVYEHVRYIYDKDNFGKVEYWANAGEVWKNKKDDCDGINVLIWTISRLSGINKLQLWSAIGEVSVGGHFWLLYFSFNKDKWYSIDGTYYVDQRPIYLRPVFGLSKSRYVRTWFIFNDSNSYKQR